MIVPVAAGRLDPGNLNELDDRNASVAEVGRRAGLAATPHGKMTGERGNCAAKIPSLD